MKSLLLIALCALFCVGSAAQNLTDSCSNIGDNSLLSIAEGFAPLSSDAGLIGEQIYPLGKGIFKKHHLEVAIEICPAISRSKVPQSELLSGETVEDINDSSYGLDGGASIIFVPGYEESGKLHLNRVGLAYSAGLLVSFSSSDRYGTLCDIMGKIGLELGHNRKAGGGFDLLFGGGKGAGDVFFYKNIVEDASPSKVTPYTAWVKKIGGQLWIKTGLLNSKTDVMVFFV